MLQWRIGPGEHPLAEQLEVRQEYRRARWIVYHAFRKECHQSAARGEEHLAVLALEFLYIGSELIVRQTVRNIIVRERLRVRIQARHPVVGAQPEIAMPVFQDAHHPVVGKAVALVVCRKLVAGLIETVEAIVGSGPDCAGMVDINGINTIAAQAAGVSRRISVNGKLASHRIKPVKSGSPTGQPQGAD